MRKKYIFIPLVVLFLSIQIIPETKIFKWPLKISNGYSSSFQEFRSGHFHGGIDIRTFQKTGYSVHAVRAGYIYKIRYVRRGSGKGIYIKHRNGLTSIYFHLSYFNEKIKRIIGRLQKIRKKKYIGNYILQKPIYVTQGELIGYSGETGSGFPHLHLEIRDKENAHINPFPLLNFPKKDNRIPVLKKLLVRSINNSSINGRVGEFSYRFVKENNRNYKIPDRIYINGEYELVLNTFDISDSGKYVAPSKLELFLNGEKVYNIEFTRFTYGDNNQLGFVYDMFFSSSSSYFYNLFNQTGFVMSKDSRTAIDIFKLTKIGINNFKIKVYDNFNNSVSGRFSILRFSNPVINIDPSGLKKTRQSLMITEFEPGPSSKIIFLVSDETGKEILRKELSVEDIIKNKILRIPGIVRNHPLFTKFLFYSGDKFIAKKCFSFNNHYLNDISDLEIEKFINRDNVVIRIKNSKIGSNNIILEVHQGNDRKSFFPEFDSEGLFFSFKPLNFKTMVNLNFSIFNNMELTAQVQKNIDLIKISDGRKQSLGFQGFEIYFAERSVREDKALLVENVSYKSSYPVLSPQYRISPYTFPFLDTVLIKFKNKVKDPEQTGIFKYSLKSKKWFYISTSIKKDEGTFVSRLLTAGVFSLMRDIFKPKIYFKRPRKLTRKNLGNFKIIITDKGKGVDYTKINSFLNGKPVLSEYDPDWRTLEIENFNKKVKKGWNSIEINLKDRAGNYSSRTTQFKVE